MPTIQTSGPRPRTSYLPGSRQLVDDGDQQLPEALDGRDANTLVGRVRELDLRAEREHVEMAGHLAADDRGLEPGVHRGDDRRLAEEALVHGLRGSERGRVQVRTPARIVVLDLQLAAGEPGDGVERGDHLRQRRVVRGARKAVQREPVALGGRLAERGARLHEVVEVGAQRQRSRRDERDGIEQRRGARSPSTGRRRLRSAATSTLTLASVFAYASRIVSAALAIAARSACSSPLATEKIAAASRGIALRLLPPASETSLNGTVVSASRSARPSTLIAFEAPSAMPVPEWPPCPPVTVTESVVASSAAALPRRVDPDPGVGAARAADREPAVLLAVEVDQDRARDERAVERVRALEPDLLGHRHQQLERTMGQRLVLDQRHHGRDRDPVVGAERRPVRGQPVAVANERDAPFRRVVRARRVALAHHVQVALEHDRRRGLAARARRNADHEVPAGVLLQLESVPVGPLANVLDHRLLVPRRTRDLRQRLEVPPERARLEPVKHRFFRRHSVAPVRSLTWSSFLGFLFVGLGLERGDG